MFITVVSSAQAQPPVRGTVASVLPFIPLNPVGADGVSAFPTVAVAGLTIVPLSTLLEIATVMVLPMSSVTIL